MDTRHLRDHVGKDFLAGRGFLDIKCPLNNPLLPSKMLILLAATCLAWVGILSLAFMAFTGSGISAGWIFAGALIAGLAVWVALMFREIQNAPRAAESFDDENDDIDLQLGSQHAASRFGFRRVGMQIFSGRRRFTSGGYHEANAKDVRIRRTERPIRPTFR
jgi:hypothetical protein